uniref:Integrase catalytic domain-containing protein n=1 Tax=Tanacetum cinerariifolium TaxID=118510 RepID=A0A6L2MBK0_TANCI|nr:hypothetical protein [Tanacetum cinerariifolium]
MSMPVTAEEKTNKKNDVKARSLLLMALPNEYQLTFSQYNDAKTMFAAIETQFGRNEATKKTQKTLLKQQYKNFNASRTESHVKKYVSASTGAQNMAFISTLSTSSNIFNTTNPTYEASTVSPNVNIASPQVSTANFSDNGMYAFMVENPNGSNLLQHDLEQIHEDNLEVMDLRWQLSLLSMKAKRKQRNNEDTSSKAMLAINGVGFDLSDMIKEQVQTNMAIMAFSDSEVNNDKSCTKTCLKNYETLKKQCDDLIVKLNQTKFIAATYKRGLASVEEQLVTYKKNEVLFREEVVALKREVACKDYEINVLKSEFEKIKQEKEGIEFKIEKFNNASKSLDKLTGSQITNSSKKGLGYHDVPPPHPLIYNGPTKLDLSYSGFDECKEPEFKGYGLRDSKQESNIFHDKKLDDSKENYDDSFVKEQVSEDTSSFVKSPLNVDKETAFYVDKKIEFMKPKHHDKPVRKLVRNLMEVILHLGEEHMVEEFLVKMCDKKNYVIFTNTECLVLSPNFKLLDESQILLKIPRKDNMYSFDMKNIVPKESLTCLVAKDTLDESLLWHRRLGHINFKNINKLGKDNLVRATKDETGKIFKNFIKEIETLVDKKVKIIRCDNGTEFKNKVIDDFCREKSIKKEYSVARTPQQNGVTERRNRTFIKAVRIINLGKFDGKSDEGFFVGYSLSSKAFRVYNTRTKKVEENLHIRFLENKPMIEGNGPKWLFDIDSLTQSMNYVPIDAGTILDESVGTQGDLNTVTSLKKEAFSQVNFVMPIWKDASYFDSLSNDVEDGPHSEDDNKDKSKDDSSPKEVNTVGKHINTTSIEVNTACFELNTVDPLLNTTSLSDPHSPTDMFKLGASDPLKPTHVEFFSDSDAQEVDLGNIPNSYRVLTTLHTRIHKDHLIQNVIGEVQSSVQTRRMAKPTFKIRFLSAIYEEKTHDTLNTCLYACFISQIEPISIAKALSDSSWVKAVQEELLQFKLQQVWILMDFPYGKKGHRQEEGIDYDKVFAPVARIKAIQLFLAYASFMGFLVYQMDVKSAFLYGTIEEEVYVTQ